MKKVLFILVMALFAATTIKADPSGLLIPLTDVPTTPTNGDNQRSPILMPVLYLDGHTLTAASGTLGSTINILDEDGDVVFTTFVYIEGDITLPSTLSGTYTIEVIRGSQTFVGEIAL